MGWVLVWVLLFLVYYHFFYYVMSYVINSHSQPDVGTIDPMSLLPAFHSMYQEQCMNFVSQSWSWFWWYSSLLGPLFDYQYHLCKYIILYVMTIASLMLGQQTQCLCFQPFMVCIRKNISTLYHALGLGWGVTGLGWVYHFIRLLCGTIYFSI